MLAVLSLLQAATGVVFRLFLGPLSDRIGKKKPIVIGGFISAAGPLVNAIAPHWTLLVIGQIIGSFQVATWNIREAFFMDRVKPEKRGVGFASFFSIMQLGSVFMPILGGYFSETKGLVQGMRISYLYYGLSIVIQSLINAKFLREEEKREIVKSKTNDSVKKLKPFSKSVKLFFQPVLRHSTLKILLVGDALSAFAFGLTKQFMVVYATNIIGISNIEWGIIKSSSGVINLLTQIPLGQLTDRFGRRKFILISSFTRPIWLLLFTLSQNFPEALFFSSLDTLSINIRTPAWQASIADNTLPENRGRVYSTFGMIRHISFSTSPSVGALLWEVYQPTLPFYLNSSIRVVVAFYLLCFGKGKKDKE